MLKSRRPQVNLMAAKVEKYYSSHQRLNSFPPFSPLRENHLSCHSLIQWSSLGWLDKRRRCSHLSAPPREMSTVAAMGTIHSGHKHAGQHVCYLDSL